MYVFHPPIKAQWVGIVSRPKLNGVGRHVGVLLPNGCVAHLTPVGVEIVSLDAFAQGHPITFDKAAPAESHWQIMWRAYQTIGRMPAYNLSQFNCEIYARFVMGEKPESPQVRGAVAIGALLLFLKLA